MRDQEPSTPEQGSRVRFVRAWPAPDGDDAAAEEPQEPEQNPFPGGRVRLPRIEEAKRRRLAALGTPGAPQAPEAEPLGKVRFVGTAFVRPGHTAAAPLASEPHGGFSEYYTYESLFETPEPEALPVVTQDDRALAELGLDRRATWSDVVAAHRQLVKETHPDLLVGADPATIEAATDRLRSINLAYARLKSARRAHHST
jgi:hypothetical protein